MFGIIKNQNKKLAYTAEENISESALSFFVDKSGTYLEACKDSNNSFITISQKSLENVNKFLREEKFAGYTGEELYQLFKEYSINGNANPATRYELSPYIKVADSSCYITVTVNACPPGCSPF